MSSGTIVKKGYIKAQLVLVPKCRYKVFRNPRTTAACKAAFDEVQQNHGIILSELNFVENHLHSLVEIPFGTSAERTVQLLKGVSARRIFQAVPNLRKRYPRGSFWSGYYHLTSVGQQTEEAAISYIKGQQEHHGLPDRKQTTLKMFFN
jgi:putative transposase